MLITSINNQFLLFKNKFWLKLIFLKIKNIYNLIESFRTWVGKVTVSTQFSEAKELLILFMVKKIPIKNISRNKLIILYNGFINIAFYIN